MNNRFFVICDILALAAINVILWSSLYIQFAHHQLPCPLCLLQRMGLFAISLGYVLNLYFGTKSRHYALSSLAALLTMVVAMIQVLMHIVPETGNYGSPLFGLHLYTWVFILSPAFICVNLILITLLNETQIVKTTYKKISSVIVVPLLVCILVNTGSAFAECGIEECPSDPTSYWIHKFFKPEIPKKHKPRRHHETSSE